MNWSDYGARWYDASIGRWNAVDQLAELYLGNSPFVYTLNNPVNYVDPDGRWVWPAAIVLAEAAGQTAVDASLDILFAFASGSPTPRWYNHVGNFISNIVPGFGEFRTLKKINKLRQAIYTTKERLDGIVGMSKLYKRTKNHLDGFSDKIISGD